MSHTNRGVQVSRYPKEDFILILYAIKLITGIAKYQCSSLGAGHMLEREEKACSRFHWETDVAA